MVDSLFIVASIVCGRSVFSPALSLLSNFAYHLEEEERAGCFTLIVFVMYCDC